MVSVSATHYHILTALRLYKKTGTYIYITNNVTNNKYIYREI